MVVIVTLPEGSGQVGVFLKQFGHGYARKMSEITYHALACRGSVPSGVIVFADRERMTVTQRNLAERLWVLLSEAGPEVRLLNDPRRQMDRYELLKRLHRDGINDYDVWKANELPDVLPFPVFVRLSRDHSGPKSDLISDVDALHAEIARLVLDGYAPEDVLVVQYLDTRDSKGLYRKYGAYRVGERFIGKHLMVGRQWDLKAPSRLDDPESLAEDTEYFYGDPHSELLMPLFDLAGIQFGRIDYTFLDGRIQVWEINDNPHYLGPDWQDIGEVRKAEPYVAALDALGEGLSQSERISFDVYDSKFWNALQPADAGFPC
jgi:hypothetical protein